MPNGLEKLKNQFLNDFKSKCDKFENELRSNTPIDTGEMITSWRTSLIDDGLRVITNKAKHAGIIARGRVFIGGRWYGSLKGWGIGGIKPLMRKHFK